MVRKLAFIRATGYGNRTWDSPRYMIPGVSPSHSVYDQPIIELSSCLHHEETEGISVDRIRQPVDEFTATRRPRIGAQFSSLAALPAFQSFANLHWSTSLAGVIARPDHTPLAKNYNPNQQGSKEQQRATVYNPWPSAGALYPKAV